MKSTGGAANATAATIISGREHIDRDAGAGYSSRAASAGARHSAGATTTSNISRPTNPAYSGQHRHSSGSRVDRVAPLQSRTTAGAPTLPSSITSVATIRPTSATTTAATGPFSATATVSTLATTTASPSSVSSYSYRSQPRIFIAGPKQQQERFMDTALSQESTALPSSATRSLPSASNSPYSFIQPQQLPQSRISSSSSTVHKAGQLSTGVQTLSRTVSSSIQQITTRVTNHRRQQQHQYQAGAAPMVFSHVSTPGPCQRPTVVNRPAVIFLGESNSTRRCKIERPTTAFVHPCLQHSIDMDGCATWSSFSKLPVDELDHGHMYTINPKSSIPPFDNLSLRAMASLCHQAFTFFSEQGSFGLT